jgi:3-oxoadipate enol-lactonase
VTAHTEPSGSLALRAERAEGTAEVVGVVAGPAVVLGHALALDRSTVAPLGRLLAAGGTVWSWEAPGHGDAAAWDGPWSHASVAAALAAELRSAGAAPAVVVGVSQGAYVSMHLALDHPDLVSALVLVSCEAGPVPGGIVPGRLAELDDWVRHGMPFEAARARAVANFGPDAPDLDAWAGRWVAEGAARHLDAYHALFGRPDLRPRLAGLGCPTLVVRGEGDPWVGAEGAAELAASVPGAAGPVSVAGGYHNPQVTRPGVVAAAVRSFLGQAVASP